MIDDRAVALWLRLSDRFGDSGLVGLAVGVPNDNEHWSIDTFLLSCRVLGREVDTTLLSVFSAEIQNRGGKIWPENAAEHPPLEDLRSQIVSGLVKRQLPDWIEAWYHWKD